MFWQLHKLHGAVCVFPVPDPDIKLRVLGQVDVPHDVPVAGVNVAGKEQFAYFGTPGHSSSGFSKKVLLLIPSWRVGFVPVSEGMVWVQQNMVVPPLLCLQAVTMSSVTA